MVPRDPLALAHIALGGRPLKGRKIDPERMMQRLRTDPKDLLEYCTIVYEAIGTKGGQMGCRKAHDALRAALEARTADKRTQTPKARDIKHPDDKPGRRVRDAHPMSSGQSPLLAQRNAQESRRISDPRIKRRGREVGWKYGGRFSRKDGRLCGPGFDYTFETWYEVVHDLDENGHKIDGTGREVLRCKRVPLMRKSSGAVPNPKVFTQVKGF